MRTAPDVREDVERWADLLRGTLAEAGWPGAVVRVGRSGDGRRLPMVVNHTCPPEVWWRACAVLGTAERCWPCWRDQTEGCDHDLWDNAPPVVRPSAP